MSIYGASSKHEKKKKKVWEVSWHPSWKFTCRLETLRETLHLGKERALAAYPYTHQKTSECIIFVTTKATPPISTPQNCYCSFHYPVKRSLWKFKKSRKSTCTSQIRQVIVYTKINIDNNNNVKRSWHQQNTHSHTVISRWQVRDTLIPVPLPAAFARNESPHLAGTYCLHSLPTVVMLAAHLGTALQGHTHTSVKRLMFFYESLGWFRCAALPSLKSSSEHRAAHVSCLRSGPALSHWPTWKNFVRISFPFRFESADLTLYE